jgi:non-ribosomal peptide synthetase-like protein
MRRASSHSTLVETAFQPVDDTGQRSKWNSCLDESATARQARLHEFFELQCDARPNATAIVHGAQSLSYLELDQLANQLAHRLITIGVCPGNTVGILLERSTHTYISLLAILKAGAAFVPIDPSFPDDRVLFIAKDSNLALLITDVDRANQLEGDALATYAVDGPDPLLNAEPLSRPAMSTRDDALCYIIYTSGTTGRPKGVAINHSSICNFLQVCGPIYGYKPSDRVYQGMTIAFDFSIEEIWPTLTAGAAIIAGPTDHRRTGSDLAEFLLAERVTVFCCVPTLLATLDRDVPSIRLLLVGGEACPRELVGKWSHPGRRMLNTYGPTETTVTATWTELHPDQPVTIGIPLPSYSVHILDEQRRPVLRGQIGEICIGGPGVARGYVNRPELTADRFIPDILDPALPNARLYRSGDLGRITEPGEIEFLGRIDSQIKIRGYRIELAEIEAVLLENPALTNAIVTKFSHEGGLEDLVAYITLRDPSADRESIQNTLLAALRERLPVYMVPAFIEVLPEMPTLASRKADRSRLPAPRSGRLSFKPDAYVPPTTDTEQLIAAAWEHVLRREKISVEADFFLDLAGHSLFAAGVISHLRKTAAFRHVSVSELYTHPTVRSLARQIDLAAAMQSLNAAPAKPAAEKTRLYHSDARVRIAGMTQLLMMYAVFLLFSIPTAFQFHGALHQSIAATLRLSLALVLLVLPVMLLVLPIAAKWLLLGKVKAGRYPLWGWFYCRFWLYRKILSFSPLDVLAGSPLLPVYARLLGVKIGRGCHIATGQLEIPDLIHMGHRVSVGYGAQLHPYIVDDGYLDLAPIHIADDAFIGANVVVMPGAKIESRARVTDQSLVARNHVVPARQTWTGSPATRTTETIPLLQEMTARPTANQRWSVPLLATFVIGYLFIETLPLLAMTPVTILYGVALKRLGAWPALLTAIPAGPLYVLTVCCLVAIGKRLIMRRATAGLFPSRSFMGFRKWFADKLMDFSLASTNTLYATLYTLPWLRLLGAKIGKRSEVSTLSHIDPDLLRIGDESFVADGASIGAATFCNGFVALGSSQIGSRCFIGNSSLVPGNSKLGDNSLLGVQSVPPPQGVADGTSWLGSPAMFLPRREICAAFDESVTYRPARRLVAMRLVIEFIRVTLPSSLLFLMLWVDFGVSMRLASTMSTFALMLVLPLVYLASGVLTVAIVIALKWAIVGRYHPRVAPNWSHFVWRTELITGLYESVALPALLDWLAGTPWLPVGLRLFGSKMGRRVYLDSTYLTEFDLVSLGNDVEIGAHTSLQSHLFEDRVMKMSTVRVGDGCSVGPRSVVLYDSLMEPGAKLDALSLVMKAETLPANTSWQGIPARLADDSG